jgi:hypothetical protein
MSKTYLKSDHFNGGGSICEHRSSDDIRVGATGDGLVADLTYSVQIGIVVV